MEGARREEKGAKVATCCNLEIASIKEMEKADVICIQRYRWPTQWYVNQSSWQTAVHVNLQWVIIDLPSFSSA
jgi:hypothetical protein